jgi:NADH-quinone oxidoreductase subunit K
MDLSFIIFLSMALLGIGVIGVLSNRNPLIVFLSIELMLNSANLLFIAFSRQWGNSIGLVWVFFALVIAAAEAAVGLAIIINLFRSKQVIDIDQYDALRG